MRLYRNAVILVVILGLLTGAYFVIKAKAPAKTSEAESTATALKIFELEKDKINEIAIENKDGKFVFVKKNGAWEATYPQNFKGSTIKVESIATNIAYLSADKLIEENAADASKYGLDKPATVTAKMQDSKEKTLEIGNETPTKDGFYVKEKGTNKVYTIASYTGKELNVSKNDLRDKFIFPTDSGEITGFSMDKKGKTVFVAKKQGKDDWTLTQPIECNVNVDGLSKMMVAVTSTNMMNFIEENAPDITKYGLDNPDYALEVETIKGKTRVLLGLEKEKGKEFYAKLADSNDVFTIDEVSVNFLDKPLKEIVEVFAYIVNISDVSNILVEIDGQKISCDLQTDSGGDSTKDKFFVNGKDANQKDEGDKSYFRKFYQALIGVSLTNMDLNVQPSGTPEITITYTLKKAPGTMKVEFIPKDGNSYYVLRNGKYSGMLVSKKKFDERDGVRDSYKKLTEAMNRK